jgi:hypothetical protein
MSTPFYANICKLLRVNPNLTAECIGVGLKNTRCRCRISEPDRAAVAWTLEQIEHLESTEKLWHSLNVIVSNLLCRYHHDQQGVVLKRWHKTLLALVPNTNSASERRIPGSFPNDDEDIILAILERLKEKENQKAQEAEEDEKKRREAEIKRAVEKRRAAFRRAVERRRASLQRAKEAELAEEKKRQAEDMRQEYLGWVSEWARVNLGTDFPDPPSYGCKDVSCISSRNGSDIE